MNHKSHCGKVIRVRAGVGAPNGWSIQCYLGWLGGGFRHQWPHIFGPHDGEPSREPVAWISEKRSPSVISIIQYPHLLSHHLWWLNSTFGELGARHVQGGSGRALTLLAAAWRIACISTYILSLLPGLTLQPVPGKTAPESAKFHGVRPEFYSRVLGTVRKKPGRLPYTSWGFNKSFYPLSGSVLRKNGILLTKPWEPVAPNPGCQHLACS